MIIPQKNINNFLKNTLESGRLGHFYIFTGDVGLGKKTFAELFIKAIYCQEKTFPPCDKCHKCTYHHANGEVLRLEKPKDKQSIGVDEIREITSKIYLKPIVNDKMCLLIAQGDLLTHPAQNAFLKVLEEPPAYLTTVLVTNNINNILATVRSRSSVLTFQKYSEQDITQYLGDLSVPTHIIKLADGSIGRINDMLATPELKEIRDNLFQEILKLPQGGYLGICDCAQVFSKENYKSCLLFLLSLYRDAVVAKVCGFQLINTDFKEQIEKFAQSISYQGLCFSLERVMEFDKDLNKGANYNLWFIDLIVYLWEEANGRNSRS